MSKRIDPEVMRRERRRYLVERVSRCVVEVEVEAHTVAEARMLAAQGEGDSVDATYQSKGTGKARLLGPAE